MDYTKTVKVPIHWDTTAEKMSCLDQLTARLTYGVRLWSDIIKKKGIKNRKELQNCKYQHKIQKQTGLSAGYVQQCGNKALWMWKQYRIAHRKWEWKLKHTNPDTKYYTKLLKREPSEPFTNQKSLIHKIPIRFDYRTGKVKKVDLKLTNWMIGVSTVKKNQKKAFLLNPSEYHKELMKSGEIRDFEIVKKKNKYYVHIVCIYEQKDIKPKNLLSIDLGINRTLTTVLFRHGKEPKSAFIKDKEKQDKLQFYNDLIGELRRGKHWKKLKRLRNKRKNIAEYYDWLTAKQLAETTKDSVVVIGKVTYIRERQYKGNGNKKHRKRINQWAFLRISHNIQHKLAQKGIRTEEIFESWTSKTCSHCGSRNTDRPCQEAIICYDCLNGFDADKNGCAGIAQRFMSRNATDGLAVTKDDLGLKPPMSLEAPCESVV